MNFKVRLSERARQAIASWPLSREMRVQVMSRLVNDLAADPDRLLGEMIVPFAYREFSFVLMDHQRFPHRHAFLFVIDRDDAARELQVVFARHTVESGEGN